MRTFAILLIIAASLNGCGGGGKRETASANNSTTEIKETSTAKVENPTPVATATPATMTGKPPVEFTYLGISPDKQTASYKIKVETTEPVSQVDLGIKYFDDAGKVMEETTFAWQNVVKSVRQPIENGKTYEVKDELPQGATKAEYTLKRVIFSNGARWEAR